MPIGDGRKCCISCGALFHCGYAAGEDQCWCYDRPRVLPVDAASDCLCPACMDRAIARELDALKRLDLKTPPKGPDDARQPS